MLFEARHWPAIEAGTLTVTFRAWKRPQVRAGGRYRTPAGVLAVDAMERVPLASVTDEDAVAGGLTGRDELLRMLGEPVPDEVWRVEFHVDREATDAGPALVTLAPDEVVSRLTRMDRASAHGPWTAAVLALLREHPARRAGDLADLLGRERLRFKADVRKLKRLGLTQSLEVGYRLTPLGEEVLRRLGG